MKTFSKYIQEEYGLKSFNSDVKFFDNVFQFLDDNSKKFKYDITWLGDKNSAHPEVQLQFYDRSDMIKLDFILNFKDKSVSFDFRKVDEKLNNLDKIIKGFDEIISNVKSFLKEFKKIQ